MYACHWINLLLGVSVLLKSCLAFECPKGEFVCGELEKCVEQKYWCDGSDECGNNADEPINCNNLEGWVKSIDTVLEQKVHPDCALPPSSYPDVCDCVNGRKLVCSKQGLSSVPTVPKNTTHLILRENNIKDIALTDFEGLTNLKVLYLSDNYISHLQPGVFRDLINLEWLFVVNNEIMSLNNESFLGLDSMFWLQLGGNLLTNLDEGRPFRHLSNLMWIDISGNRLTNIGATIFQGEYRLHTLDLSHNQIVVVEPGAFVGQENLTVLRMDSNNLTLVPSSIMHELPMLITLSLSGNPLILDETSFANFSNLLELNLTGVDILNINSNMFKEMKRLAIIHFKRFEYCKYAYHVQNCNPKTDGISSAENLLEGAILKISVWTIALLTTCGNLNVFISRIALRAENKVHSIVVSNLCAADFLMGLYLFAIGIQDVRYRNNYINFALEWSESWGCHFVGFLALLSTEASVLTLTFISLERFFIVAFPYRFHRLNIREVISVLVVIWVVAFILAASPLVFTSYFNNFYGTNGVCFPLHIHDPRLDGWEYSIFIFLGINTVSFTVIITSYCGMFHSIQKTRKRTTTLLPGDINYAKRFFFIVLTDCICWLPLAAVKLFALAEVDISKSVYAWIVIFVLPINSALNPIIYTLSTGPFRRFMLQSIKGRTGNGGSTSVCVPRLQRHSNESCQSADTRGGLRCHRVEYDTLTQRGSISTASTYRLGDELNDRVEEVRESMT